MNSNKLKEIYLDCNATTPVLALAATAAQEAMQSLYGNPSSTHITGLKARYILESTRDRAKKVIGADSGQVIFVSGATEGIQTAIFSALYHYKLSLNQQSDKEKRYLLYGATEHKAVPNSLSHWNEILGIGGEVVAIPVDAQGKLDHNFIAGHIEQAIMICTMAVNNETGVFQDILALEKCIRLRNPTVPWMVDSVQALGKMPLKLAATSIDYAPFSGHKLYGPKGIGILYVREHAPLTPVIAGGGQESGFRSGTENLPGVAAFGAILKALDEGQDELFKSHQQLNQFRARLVTTLENAFPGIVFNMPFETSVPTTINFSIADFPSKEILDLFDAAQIRVSSGSACSSTVTRSFVLDAMGLPAWRSESAIRMSFGPATDEQEIEAACERLSMAAKALTQSCLILPTWNDGIDSPRQNGLMQLKKGNACTWIYADAQSQTCLIIDPIEELGERIEKFVTCQQYRVLAILDTHSHADHESCRPMLQQLLQHQLAFGINEYDALGWPLRHCQEITLANGRSAPAIILSENRVLTRILTPGHTSDSQSFLLGHIDNEQLPANAVNFAFAGDMVLIGGLGRTNFTSSSASLLYDSLLTLNAVINPDTVICPAHDYNNQFATTLAAETAQNRLIREVLSQDLNQQQFIQEKAAIDRHLSDQGGAEIICGVVKTELDAEGIHIKPTELHNYLRAHPNTRVVDVREAHEYQLFTNWDKLNLGYTPDNVPLSKMTAFIGELMNDAQKYDKDLLFICRSGARSGRLAETFRRLGFANTAHVAGGIALSCC